jgi:hypothetical protein
MKRKVYRERGPSKLRFGRIAFELGGIRREEVVREAAMQHGAVRIVRGSDLVRMVA